MAFVLVCGRIMYSTIVGELPEKNINSMALSPWQNQIIPQIGG
jgi:hypothetical protein